VGDADEPVCESSAGLVIGSAYVQSPAESRLRCARYGSPCGNDMCRRPVGLWSVSVVKRALIGGGRPARQRSRLPCQTSNGQVSGHRSKLRPLQSDLARSASMPGEATGKHRPSIPLKSARPGADRPGCAATCWDLRRPGRSMSRTALRKPSSQLRGRSCHADQRKTDRISCVSRCK
jgi:hypothetical protein